MPPAISPEEQLKRSNKALAYGILSVGVFNFCSIAAFNDDLGSYLKDIEFALSWASMVALLGAFYYFQYLVCQRCTKGKKLQQLAPYSSEQITVYRDLPSNPDSSNYGLEREVESEEERRPGQNSAVTLPPEMSPFNVLLYAYGWGLMFFVSLYCLSGVYVPGANWFAFGFLVISLDELMHSNAGKSWISLLTFFVAISSISVWWGILGQFSIDQSYAEILTGVVAPAFSPFMLYSLRMNPRVLHFNGVHGLLKIALPFMVVLSMCILVIQSVHYASDVQLSKEGDSGRRLLFNESNKNNFIATSAPFGNDTGRANNFRVQSSHDLLLVKDTTKAEQLYHAPEKLIALMLSPIAALATLYNLISSVVNNCATEFLVAFTLCTAVRFGTSREYDAVSAMAVSASGLAFILIVLFRRTTAR